jgi:hypothetical protein
MRLLPALLGMACGENLGRVPAAAPDTPAATSSAAGERLTDTDWGTARLDAPPLELQLPELSQWRAGPGRTWARLEHPASQSTLELWLDRAERLVRPADCAARARITRPGLWQPEPEAVVDEQRLDAPAGFRTELTVGIDAADVAGTVHGFVLGFGASVGRCYAFSFATRADGPTAEIEIARRLDLVATRIAPSVAVLAVEDRVRVQPLR